MREFLIAMAIGAMVLIPAFIVLALSVKKRHDWRSQRMTDVDLKERAEVVECLAKRICRDLRHALDDVPATCPHKAYMVERYLGFKQDLGDTADYVHALHYEIRRLTVSLKTASAPTEALPNADAARLAIWSNALTTVANWPISDMRRNLDAVNMARCAGNALAVAPPSPLERKS